MYEDPQDMFREMDRLFSGIFDSMGDGFPGTEHLASGYPVIVRQRVGNPALMDSREIPIREISDPGPEVHRMGDEVIVVTGVPGATMESINLHIRGPVITIEADGGPELYQTSVTLPPVDPGSLQTSLKNGVLEVRFRSLPRTGEEEC
jgi:HSP20 family molecular chaperone IbpA